jgi:hypothetical protein
MNRLLQALTALLMVALVAAPALGATGVAGTITPGPTGYRLLCAPGAIDAQNGLDVIVKGTIGNLPADSGYWVQIGLIPKAVCDEMIIAGTITSLWDEGVYLLSAMDSGGVFSVSAEDYEAQVGAPARSPVANDGSIAFKLTLKPALGRMGGSATLRIDGAKTNLGKDTLTYGKRLATDASKTEDYSEAYLVCQVMTTGATNAVSLWASAAQLKDAVRVTRILTYDAGLNERDTFSPGEVVTVQTRYKVLSTRTNRLQYEVRGEVKLLGTTQGVSENRRTGRYGFNKSFLIPANTNPGTYKVLVTLQLVRHLTDHYTNEPYEELLYTEEVFDKITVQ